MILISPEMRIRLTLKRGCVYLFNEPTFGTPQDHFFVILNKYAHKDEELIFVNATSQVQRREIARQRLPTETIVHVNQSEYPLFDKPTVFDCNSITKKTVSRVISLLSSNQLKVCTEMMPDTILEKLVAGVLTSPLVEDVTKTYLS